MFILFINIVYSRQIPNLNLFTFLLGNWTTKINPSLNVEITNHSKDFLSTQFIGYYDENEIIFNLKTNKSTRIQYLDFQFELNFETVLDGVATAETILKNGKYLSIVIFNTNSFEITLVNPQTQEFKVIGFNKDDYFQYTLKVFLIPTSIAIFIMFFGKKLLSKLDQ